MIGCLTQQHTVWVFPLAALVCWVSSHTALRLVRQMREGGDHGRWIWLGAASFSAGAGVWSTHFIGMLGYDPGIAIHYDLRVTLISLAVGIGAVMAALALLRQADRGSVAAVAGVVLGLGVAAMHFTGMAGVQVPGRLGFDRTLALAAVAGGCGLAAAAFVVAIRPRVARRGLDAALLTASIAVLHFTAMGAAEIIPDAALDAPGLGLPRLALACGIAAAMLAILGFAALALFAERLRRSNQALRASETACRLSEERLALAIDGDGSWDLTVATGVMWFSDRWETMLGYTPGELARHLRTWEALLHPEDEPQARRLFAEHLDGHSPVYECEHRLRRKDGGWGWVLARGKVVARDGEGVALRVVGMHFDTTHRREAERRLAHMALHDALTGLPNRVLFRDRLNQQLADIRRHGGSFAVLACDLDRFKAVNDTYGHPAGDALLAVIAERLRGVVRTGDIIARLGGDEFAIIVGHLDTLRAATLVAQRVIAAVEQPVEIGPNRATVGVSIGIATAAGDEDADELFKRADIALYRAKAEGRNTLRFYEAGMDAALAKRNLLERDLREALRAGSFVLHYQPIVGLEAEAPSGFEALLRWPHPERGLIPPAEFIPLAEESGLIVPLGAWALREACREAAAWPGRPRVAVNVSAVQFRDESLESTVLGALAASGLAPDRLELEITESVLMDDGEASLACLRRLKALGVRIALDDFGTGYSSLSYLRRFPFDKIKVDRTFIREIADPDTAAIVRSIVGLGERLGAAITAEGVETPAQLDHVRALGCTEAQGFLLGVPRPAAEALRATGLLAARDAA
ncbi:bifunctional diguanylate cyclase/phosphodiesterase [Methylobacterium sp. A54F]